MEMISENELMKVSSKEQCACITRGYELSSTYLGGGAVGRVFLARATKEVIERNAKLQLIADGREQLQVAIKIIYADLGAVDISKLAKYIPSEVANMNRAFGHPNIIMLLDVFISCKRIFLVMELASQGSLKDLCDASHKTCSKRALSEPEARYYFREIIHGVFALHSRNIAHRDLKLDNILVCKHGVKIGDFGFSVLTTKCRSSRVIESARLIASTTQCGTPSFMAPEILSPGQRYNATAVDIWSLGVILYSLLNSSYPYPGSTPADVLRGIENQGEKDLTFRQGVSKDGRDFVRLLLTRDPSKRPGIFALILHPWLQGPDTLPNHYIPPTTNLDKEKISQILEHPDRTFEELYVQSYLLQRYKLLNHKLKALDQQRNLPRSVALEIAVLISLPRREDRKDELLHNEVWRLKGPREAATLSKLVDSDLVLRPSYGLPFNCIWAANQQPESIIGFAPARRIITDHSMIATWLKSRDAGITPRTKLDKAIQLYNTVDLKGKSHSELSKSVKSYLLDDKRLVETLPARKISKPKTFLGFKTVIVYHWLNCDKEDKQNLLPAASTSHAESENVTESLKNYSEVYPEGILHHNKVTNVPTKQGRSSSVEVRSQTTEASTMQKKLVSSCKTLASISKGAADPDSSSKIPLLNLFQALYRKDLGPTKIPYPKRMPIHHKYRSYETTATSGSEQTINLKAARGYQIEAKNINENDNSILSAHDDTTSHNDTTIKAPKQTRGYQTKAKKKNENDNSILSAHDDTIYHNDTTIKVPKPISTICPEFATNPSTNEDECRVEMLATQAEESKQVAGHCSTFEQTSTPSCIPIPRSAANSITDTPSTSQASYLQSPKSGSAMAAISSLKGQETELTRIPKTIHKQMNTATTQTESKQTQETLREEKFDGEKLLKEKGFFAAAHLIQQTKGECGVELLKTVIELLIDDLDKRCEKVIGTKILGKSKKIKKFKKFVTKHRREQAIQASDINIAKADTVEKHPKIKNKQQLDKIITEGDSGSNQKINQTSLGKSKTPAFKLASNNTIMRETLISEITPSEKSKTLRKMAKDETSMKRKSSMERGRWNATNQNIKQTETIKDVQIRRYKSGDGVDEEVDLNPISSENTKIKTKQGKNLSKKKNTIKKCDRKLVKEMETLASNSKDKQHSQKEGKKHNGSSTSSSSENNQADEALCKSPSYLEGRINSLRDYLWRLRSVRKTLIDSYGRGRNTKDKKKMTKGNKSVCSMKAPSSQTIVSCSRLDAERLLDNFSLV